MSSSSASPNSNLLTQSEKTPLNQQNCLNANTDCIIEQVTPSNTNHHYNNQNNKIPNNSAKSPNSLRHNGQLAPAVSPKTAPVISIKPVDQDGALKMTLLTAEQQQRAAQQNDNHKKHHSSSSFLHVLSAHVCFCQDTTQQQNNNNQNNNFARKSRRKVLCWCVLVILIMIGFGALLSTILLWDTTNSSGNATEVKEVGQSSGGAHSLSRRWQLPQCQVQSLTIGTKCPPFSYRNVTSKLVEDESQIADDNHWSGVQPVKYEVLIKMLNLNRGPDGTTPAIDYNNRMPFTGEVRLIFRVVRPTKQIIVHRSSESVDIKSVQLEAFCSGTVICIKSVLLEAKGDHFVINTAQLLEVDEHFTLTIAYGALNHGYKSGLYVMQTPTSVGVSSLFQMRYARLVLPLLDLPSLKARFALCLVHKSNQSAASNSRIVSHESVGGGFSKTCFDETVPMPSYVFTFSLMDSFLGENLTEENTGLPDIRVIHPKSVAASRVSWLRHEAVQRVARLQNMTGMPYVMDKLDFIVTDTPYWGIENMGLIAMDSQYAVQAETIPRAHETLTHEVIHMWLGNTFTVSTWSEICLQEGLTQYLEWLITDESGLIDLRTNLEMKHSDVISGERHSAPIIRAMNSTSDIAKYCFTKPTIIFHMIRDAFQPNLWFEFMKYMSHQYKYSHAGLTQWTLALNNITGDTKAGRMLTDWFTKPGYPVLKVTETSDRHLQIDQQIAIDNKLSVRQHPITINESFLFRLSLIDKNSHAQTGLMEEPSLTMSLPRPMDNADTLYHYVLNANHTVLTRVAYPVRNYLALLRACVLNRVQGGPQPTYCLLDFHQLNYIMADFCWSLSNSLLPVAESESRESWGQVFQMLLEHSERGSEKKVLNIPAQCRCCMKDEETVRKDTRFSPFDGPPCLSVHNDVCRHTRLMSLLGRHTLYEKWTLNSTVIGPSLF